MNIWTALLEALGEVLRFFHDITVGLFGEYSWVAAIVLLTVSVRVVMLPLAVKQFRSMQAMQSLRPQMKRIQDKYKTDRSMMRTDPDKYKERRQKQQEELMGLYKEHNVNPASSCLPLIAQMPIFIALFSLLRSPDVIPELVDAPFFGSTLQAPASAAGIVAIVMLLAMGLTTFVQQKQMMGRNAAATDDQAMQQQKLMLYIMPVFLTVLGYSLPVGILVYWVTTNLWQTTQQWFMLREMSHAAPVGGSGSSGKAGGGRGVAAQSSSDTKNTKDKNADDSSGKRPAKGGKQRKDDGRSAQQNKKRPKGKRDTESGTRGKRSGDTGGNGHRPGGPGQISKKRNETGDKRR
jgi:YidC/Oxa1 family membrane protein insertase